MGQAWCKERTTKAQDSKSPLDRVFVRCAHQMYPTLKQDGSVLGGATQRVTSSEIGYAGSPPREALTRGESVDSIDRPFHPSEWVDVNLEVPSTPSSVITNLTANTSLYQTTTLSSTGSNLKNITPIPPPRRRRKNRGRPLPPKPDESVKSGGNVEAVKKIEPLYSSVKSNRPKARDEESEASKEKSKSEEGEEEKENRRNDRKVNGTGGILAITKVTEGDRWTADDPGEAGEQRAHHQNQRNQDHKNLDKNVNKKKRNNNDDEGEEGVSEDKKNNRDSEYEIFSKSRDPRSSSTPSGPGKNSERESNAGKDRDLREFLTRTVIDDDDILDVALHRPKNYSTVSLPNYDELEVVKKEVEREAEEKESELATPKKPGRVRNVSTISLPVTEIMESLSQGTTERIEKYMTRCRSFGSLQPHEILDKLKAHGEQIDSSDEDEWGGLDDWDLGVVEYSEPNDGRSPLEPSSRLRERKGTIQPMFHIGGSDVVTTKREELKVDIPKATCLPDRDKSPKNESGISGSGKATLTIPRNGSFEVPKSPNSLKSALKAEANRKISMPARLSSDKPGNPLEDWFSAQERSVRFFEAPKLEEEYANTPGHRPAKPSEARKPEPEYDTRSYPFNGSPTGPINIDTFFETSDDFGGTKSKSDSPGRRERVKSLTRSLSNESEPFDGYEEKELTLEIRSQHSSVGKLSRTISDESIPAEMAGEGDDSLNEKRADDRTAKPEDSKTPPPSPEPKIHAEILANDHFPGARPASLKIQREEEGGSNLSSMTPSLTELEAALSDMLEKEDQEEPRPGQDHVEDSENSNLRHSERSDSSKDGPTEPEISAKGTEREDSKVGEPRVESNLFARRRKENVTVTLGQILNDPSAGSAPLNTGAENASERTARIAEGGNLEGGKTLGKNPFEDTDDEDDDRDNDEPGEGSDGSKAPGPGSKPVNPFDGEPPEKPSRLHKVPLDHNTGEIPPEVPTPPQRKNKHGAISPTTKSPTSNTDTEFPIRDSTPHPNDRLI